MGDFFLTAAAQRPTRWIKVQLLAPLRIEGRTHEAGAVLQLPGDLACTLLSRRKVRPAGFFRA
jgi:hypothetical protein